MSDLDHALADLISAYHVLHHHKIFQEYGSISVRNPENPGSFFTSCFPAILVSSRDHLHEFKVSDGEYVKPPPRSNDARLDFGAPTPEIFIHSCIYDRFPGVQSVVHSQTEDGIVYGLCDAGGSMMMPVSNMAGFLGHYNPIFNPAKHYDSLSDSHPQDLRVSHRLLGDKMADLLHDSRLDGASPRGLPDYGCVLLRGNGVAIWNDSIQGAVSKAIHLERNTSIQTTAMLQRAHSSLDLTYLNEREAADSERMTSRILRFMWSAWLAEVQGQSRYRNDISLERNLIG